MMSRWDHSFCDRCWNETTETNPREPVRMVDPEPLMCCRCGDVHVSGIYVRGDPKDLLCGGEHDSTPQS